MFQHYTHICYFHSDVMSSFCNVRIPVLGTCSETSLQTDCPEVKYLPPYLDLLKKLDSPRLYSICFLAWLSSWDSWMLTSSLEGPPVSYHRPSWRLFFFTTPDFLSSFVPESPHQGHSDFGGQSPRQFHYIL